MTRDEAIALLQNTPCEPGNAPVSTEYAWRWIDAFERLGMLTLDKHKHETKFIDLVCAYAPNLRTSDGQRILAIMASNGLRIAPK